MLNFASDLLDAAFVDALQSQARKLARIEKVVSSRQWMFGGMVNAEWKRNGYEGEITKEDFYVECSRAINSALPFPLVAENGGTLRRWCEVAESYVNLPALEEFREVLSFDHFYQARRMANNPMYNLPAPDIALAQAVERKWTAPEMVYHYSPKEPVHEYDKVIGWLDSLQAIDLARVIKDGEKLHEAKFHLDQFRQIVESKR